MSNSTAILANPVFTEYLGYRYEQETDDQGDNIKLIHNVIYIKTGRIAGSIDCSPYCEPTLEEVHQKIESISESNCEQAANGITPACYEPAATPVQLPYAILHADVYRATAILGEVTPKLARGKKALVFKGRKIQPGTEVQIFWLALVTNKFNHQRELRAGVTLPDGSKVFCSADNLEPLPTDAEMATYAAAFLEHEEAVKALKDAEGTMR